jgi:hypothetical protein
MASETGIANRALQRLGATRITALDDASTKNGRACNVAYEPLRDALLRMHPWSFAITRAALAADSAAPVGDDAPAYQYTWPTDALRILLPKDHTLDWIIEGRKILTDWDAPLYIRYIAKITDPNTMDPLFREALSALMAAELCDEITQSNPKKDRLKDDFDRVIAEARRTNAIEKPAVGSPDGSWDYERD